MDKIGQNKKVKVVVAMSGGVDSSVSAALLKRAGFDVVGIMMKFWSDKSDSCNFTEKKNINRCCSDESEKMARLVAKQLKIPFYVVNAEKEFKKRVVDYFLKEYKEGRTPNPCAVCNKEIKFGLLIEKALKIDGEFIATGHYANIKNGKLFKGKDKAKDQSYFLWQLNQKQIKHILFPVGEYTKSEVRKLAKKFKLPTAENPESQEVCFVQKNTSEFLKKYLKTKPGHIIEFAQNGASKKIGEHQGLWFYTIGQRKGIGLSGGPYYVVDKDFKNNNLIVSKNQKDLLKKEFIVKNINWISGKKPKLPIRAKVMIRYRTKPADALIHIDKENSARVIFDHLQKAITSGQSAVFYKGKEVLGGGVIDIN